MEELLQGLGGEVPDDDESFVFPGVGHVVQVDSGRFGRCPQHFSTPGEAICR